MWPGCDHWYAMVWPNGSKWPFLIWDGDVHWFRTNQNQNHGFSNFEVPKNADSTSFRFKHVKHVDCLFFMGAFANSRFLSGAFRRRSLRRSILLNVMRRPYSGANLGDQPPLDPADLSQRDPTVRVFLDPRVAGCGWRSQDIHRYPKSQIIPCNCEGFKPKYYRSITDNRTGGCGCDNPEKLGKSLVKTCEKWVCLGTWHPQKPIIRIFPCWIAITGGIPWYSHFHMAHPIEYIWIYLLILGDVYPTAFPLLHFSRA